MKILATGVTGFLGASFAEAAARDGHELHAVVRRPSSELGLATSVVVKDVRAIRGDDLPAGLDAVVHFATGSDGSAEEMAEVAVDGTLASYAAARGRGVPRFVHVSSMSVYPGPVAPDPSAAGGLALEPRPESRGAYASSKTLAERALQAEAARARSDGPEIVILRPGLVFGWRMASPLAGVAIELPLGLALGLGSATQGVPLLEAADFCRGLLALLEKPAEPGTLHTFDVLSGDPPDKRDLLRHYGRLSGRDLHAVWLPYRAARAATAVIDAARSVAGGRASLAHAVRRLYTFEPRDLPHERFWEAVALRPRGSLQTAIRSALTPEAPAPSPGSGGGEGTVRREARILLACARRPAPSGPPIPVILLGAGRIAQEMHLPALRSLRRLAPTAVVDANLGLATRAAAALPGCRAVASLAELDDQSIAGATAVVATPGFTHVELGQELLERGASLVLEKPAALTLRSWRELARAARAAAQPVTIVHNYRLRPGSLELWDFLVSHDVGPLVDAQVGFRSPPIQSQKARWMRDEKANRVLLLEMALHLLDLVFVVGGGIEAVRHAIVVDDLRGHQTLSFKGVAELEHGATLRFELDVAGRNRLFQVVLTFERATCLLDFYPDRFRVLPTRYDPLADIASDLGRLLGAVGQRLRAVGAELPPRALPHHAIYREHLAALDGTARLRGFSLEAVAPTMTSLFRLADALYERSGTRVAELGGAA